MSLKDYRISLLPHVTRIVADATATKAQPLGAVPTAGRRRSLFLAPRQNQHFLMVLFAGYADLADSLSHLRQIDRYLTRTPTRTAPTTRSAYLSYHYNAFLNTLAENVHGTVALYESVGYRVYHRETRFRKALASVGLPICARLTPFPISQPPRGVFQRSVAAG